MAQRKQFKDLDLSNAFLFSAALEDEETCRLVLECILGTPVGRLKVKAERNILYSSDFRCVRLDIFASDELNVGYNLEMQNADEKNLPKRSRYHQAQMDLSSLKPGQDFNELKPSVIIFICAFDPFGKGLYRYTFEERCLEEDIPLNDGSKKIFLSTVGTDKKNVPEGLISFLKYVMNSTDECADRAEDEKLKKIHGRIKTLKQSRKLEEKYMLVEELLKRERKEGHQEGYDEGHQEGYNLGHDEGHQEGYNLGHDEGHREGYNLGRDEGSQQMLKLVTQMTADGKADQIPRLESEKAFRQEMLKKYNL